MTRRHSHRSKVITAFVRIPEPLEDGKVRCNGCSRVVTITPSGWTRAHRSPAGEECAYRTNYKVVALDELPPVVLPASRVPKERKPREPKPIEPKPERTDRGYSTAPRSGYCQVDGCGKCIGPDRTLCGYHLATRRSA